LCPLRLPRPPTSTRFPYTTLFRSVVGRDPPVARRQVRLQEMLGGAVQGMEGAQVNQRQPLEGHDEPGDISAGVRDVVLERLALRSEEHTSELQSRVDLVCRLLLEK